MIKIIILFSTFISLTAGAQTVKWYTFEQAIKLNQTEPRKILIDVYTDWCGWCKVMDKNTFSNPIVAAYLTKMYYPVKLNAEQRDSILYKGTTFRYVAQGARGYHELAAALLSGEMSYPAIVFMSEQEQVIYVQRGYMEAQPFDEIINFIGGDFFKTEAWETWRAAYKSPFITN